MKYRLKGLWRWVLLGLAVAIFLMSLVIMWQLWHIAHTIPEIPQLFSLLSVALGLPLLALNLFLWYVYHGSFLVLEARGISYHQPGATLFMAWQDVACITDVRYGRLQVKGLQGEQVRLQGGFLSTAFLRMTQQNKHIPLTPFMPNWQQELTEYIAMYAIPHAIPHAIPNTSE